MPTRKYPSRYKELYIFFKLQMPTRKCPSRYKKERDKIEK